MEAYDAPHILSVPPHAFAESGYLSYVTNTVFSTWIFIVIVAILSGILYLASKKESSLLLDWFLAFAPGFHDYLRPINSDINTTLGMAVLMILISHIIMIRFHGVFGYIFHYIFNFKGKTVIDKFINVFVGWLHLVGELVRIMALSLRLF